MQSRMLTTQSTGMWSMRKTSHVKLYGKVCLLQEQFLLSQLWFSTYITTCTSPRLQPRRLTKQIVVVPPLGWQDTPKSIMRETDRFWVLLQPLGCSISLSVLKFVMICMVFIIDGPIHLKHKVPTPFMLERLCYVWIERTEGNNECFMIN